MKRIGIMTFLHNDNYGSTLQAWALQSMLREAGYDAVHLDYAPDMKQKITNLIGSHNSPALLLDSLRRHKVKKGQEGARDKSAAFRAFYHDHMQLTRPCHNAQQLAETAKDMDALICGSDQVWSPEWFNPAYFLNFAGNQPRIAYACSLGVSRMDSRYKAKRIQSLLKPFAAISVREAQGASLLAPLCDKPLTVMPDPVLLQDETQWRSLSMPWKHSRPYIACYFIGNREDYWQNVRSLQQETGLDVVVIPVHQEAFGQGYTLAQGLSPSEWLGVLDGAEQVVTDSFHGTVFSLLLQKPFTILRRYSDDSAASKNSRIDNIMRLMDMEGVDHCDDPSPALEKLKALREEGRGWLLIQLQKAGL